MLKTSAPAENDASRRPEPEPKGAQKPKPEIKGPPEPVTGETQLSPEDAHIGGTEDQMSDLQAPAGDLFDDEPRQG
jgi:hypothetical protein